MLLGNIHLLYEKLMGFMWFLMLGTFVYYVKDQRVDGGS